MQNKRSLFYIILFLALVLAVWTGFSLIPHASEAYLPATDGFYDLSGKDFDNTVYVSSGYWQSWPNQLLTPEQIETGAAGEPAVLSVADYAHAQYYTHQMKLILPPGQTYGLTLKSCDYSMRFFINSGQIDLVGVPGDSRETTTPRVLERVYYFTPRTGDVTFTVQAANFVHKDGGSPPTFTIGTAENIAAFERNNSLLSGVIIGCLLTAFLYHLALFLLNRRQRGALVFSICCLLLMLLTHKLIPVFWPDYNWFVAFRLEYVVHFSTFAMLALLLDVLFPGLLNKWVLRAYWTLCGVYVLLTLVLDPTVYTGLLVYFHIVSVGMIVYILARLIMSLRGKKLKNLLALLGLAAVCLLGINDILWTNHIMFIGNFAGQIQTTPVGMVFFVFCYALVVSLDFAETQRLMEEARHEIARAEERYNALLAEQQAGAPKVTMASLHLSRREEDVAWLLLDGKTRPEAAHMTGLSMGTVNTYCSRIYQKAGVKSALELMRLLGLPPKNGEKK